MHTVFFYKILSFQQSSKSFILFFIWHLIILLQIQFSLLFKTQIWISVLIHSNFLKESILKNKKFQIKVIKFNNFKFSMKFFINFQSKWRFKCLQKELNYWIFWINWAKPFFFLIATHLFSRNLINFLCKWLYAQRNCHLF